VASDLVEVTCGRRSGLLAPGAYGSRRAWRSGVKRPKVGRTRRRGARVHQPQIKSGCRVGKGCHRVGVAGPSAHQVPHDEALDRLRVEADRPDRTAVTDAALGEHPHRHDPVTQVTGRPPHRAVVGRAEVEHGVVAHDFGQHVGERAPPVGTDPAETLDQAAGRHAVVGHVVPAAHHAPQAAEHEDLDVGTAPPRRRQCPHVERRVQHTGVPVQGGAGRRGGHGGVRPHGGTGEAGRDPQACGQTVGIRSRGLPQRGHQVPARGGETRRGQPWSAADRRPGAAGRLHLGGWQQQEHGRGR